MTEVLLELARSGKTFVVETHSDLVVRRMLRAILEERISQEQVCIYFASLVENEGFMQTDLQHLSVNSKGRVNNWPEGFMDDDVRESRRLIEIMYADRDEGSDELEDEA